MLFLDFIINDIKPLALGDTVAKAKDLIASNTLSHVPVVDGEKLIAMLSEADIQTLDDNYATIADLTYLFDSFQINVADNWFDAIKTFGENDANIIPVLSQEQKYMGYYELMDFISLLNDMPLMEHMGATIIISKGLKDYSISQISQIIESENGRILGLFVSKLTAEKAYITIKLATEQLNNILSDFRRYGYHVISDNVDDKYIQELKERSNYLTRFFEL
jgi:CBS domain-containing protein